MLAGSSTDDSVLMGEKQVLLYLRQSTSTIGGAEVVIRRTVAGLDSTRFQVVLVCLKKPGMQLAAIRTTMEGVPLNYVELENGRLLDFRCFWRILKLLRRYPGALVHCHDPKTDFYGFLIRLLKPRTRVMSTLHGWVVTRWRGAWYKRLDQFFIRFFHAVVAVSPALEKEARDCGVDRVHLIENGINVQEMESALRITEPPFERGAFRWIGYLGRVSAEKGPLDFIRTASWIARDFPLARFAIAGDGPLLPEMKALARAEGIEHLCLFLGAIRANQVPGFLSQLDLLLSTSETEGIPNTLLEAGALGIPIVATAVGGVPQVVTHGRTGFLAPAGAIDQLAFFALDLLRDDALRAAFAQESRAWIADAFSIKLTVQKLSHLYQRVLSSSHGR